MPGTWFSAGARKRARQGGGDGCTPARSMPRRSCQLLSPGQPAAQSSPQSSPAPAWTPWAARTLSCQMGRCASRRHACRPACGPADSPLLLPPFAAACLRCCRHCRRPLLCCDYAHPSGERLLAVWLPPAPLPPTQGVRLGRPARHKAFLGHRRFPCESGLQPLACFAASLRNPLLCLLVTGVSWSSYATIHSEEATGDG